MIRTVIMYETDGKQFESLKKAIQHREDKVEAFIRKLPGVDGAPHKDYINFIQAILDNRRELIALLDYDDKPVDLDED